uniref:Myosin IG n=1 Tax=Mus musculus TaxID=10090 RepID=D6RHL4_MOUSE
MLAVGRMEDEEGPEYGKPDFVLLDQLTMEDFMKNLELRGEWGREDRSQQAHHAVHCCCHQPKPEG